MPSKNTCLNFKDGSWQTALKDQNEDLGFSDRSVLTQVIHQEWLSFHELKFRLKNVRDQNKKKVKQLSAFQKTQNNIGWWEQVILLFSCEHKTSKLII